MIPQTASCKKYTEFYLSSNSLAFKEVLFSFGIYLGHTVKNPDSYLGDRCTSTTSKQKQPKTIAAMPACNNVPT
jgi:hypothetical protein